MEKGKEGRREGRNEGGMEGGRTGGTNLVPPEGIFVVAVHHLMEVEDNMGPIRNEETPPEVDRLRLELLQLGDQLRDMDDLREGEGREGGRKGGREGGREERRAPTWISHFLGDSHAERKEQAQERSAA
jgi:hypothetical protein